MIDIGGAMMVTAVGALFLGWFLDKGMRVLSDKSVVIWESSCVALSATGALLAVLGAIAA